DTNYSSTPQRLAFWFSLIVVQVLAWSFLLLSQRRLRRALQEVDIKTGPRSEQRALMNVVRSRMFLWKGDPVQWLVIRDRAATNLLWMVAAIEVGYYAFSWASVHGLIFDWQPEVMWPVWGLADLVTDALIAAAAWRFFFEARRKGILEILLTTPLGAGRIIKNQWQALKKKMRWPIAVALSAMLVNSVAMADAFSAPGAIEALPISWVLELATVLTGIGAVCWLAMYFAVKGHTHTGILVRTLGLATGIPAVFRTICLFGLQSWRTVPPGNDFWSQFPAWAEEAIVATYFVALWLFGRGRLEWTLSGRECIKTQRTLSFTSKSIQTVRRTTQPYP
ncbi:MAG TPA: hypothetical protein VLT36_09435, partial [Candidatus Dormibacteraeota bacterium]|nr:hypothetical protein [Candidatus Dormibacteraeota bacterium]